MSGGEPAVWVRVPRRWLQREGGSTYLTSGGHSLGPVIIEGDANLGRFRGITYPRLLGGDRALRIWRRVGCPREWHLWDEVLSFGAQDGHYLHCDACELIIYIRSIDESYVRKGGVDAREETEAP